MKIINKKLFKAIENNNLDKVKLLIKQGADANIKKETGWTPMHSAAQVGSIEIIHFLISYGAILFEITTVDINGFKKGIMPCEVAEILGNNEAAEYLRYQMYAYR